MGKSKTIQKIKNDCVYYLVKLVYWFLNILPRPPAKFIGASIGLILYLFIKRERQKADNSLKMVYGDKLNVSQRKAIVRNFCIYSGMNMVDVIRMKKYYHSQIAHLVDVEGREHFEKAYRRGKGVLGITGHIGNFELLAVWFVSNGYQAAAIGREMYDRRLNKMLVNNREAMGLINVDTKDSPRKLLKLLKEGFSIGVLIDTDSMRVKSAFIPAFGRLSWTPIGQSILGLKTGAAFVPMACVRTGKRYKVIIKPEIKIESAGDFDKDVYNITKQCTEALEEIIDDYRDQWIWIHNRWHTRPEDKVDSAKTSVAEQSKGADI